LPGLLAVGAILFCGLAVVFSFGEKLVPPAKARDYLVEEAQNQHRYADTVLLPKFTSLYNDWVFRHPQDPPGREGEHWKRVDAGDIKRWQEVRKAFRELDSTLSRAGY
jgi:hypothetical protein